MRGLAALHATTIVAVPGAADILIVVPTLGQRPAMLTQALQSIRSQGAPSDIAIVAPTDNAVARQTAEAFNAEFIADPGSLAAAINLGMQAAQEHHQFVGWLNDDDELEPGSLAVTSTALIRDPSAVVAFGACRYVNEAGNQLWISRAGRWGVRILHWGPDLIPQPGMLIRREAWDRVGGLDTTYELAFDLDLLLRVKRLGGLVDTGQVVSRFRWHQDSLTVDDRTKNLRESERAKRAALPKSLQPIAPLWEMPVRSATRLAVAQMNRRAASAR